MRIRTTGQARRLRNSWQVRSRVMRHWGLRSPDPWTRDLMELFGVPSEDVTKFYADNRIGNMYILTPPSTIMAIYNEWKAKQ